MTQPNPAVPVAVTVNDDQARVASYATYPEAQAAVDLLSDRDFPVAGITIVGTGLRSVERVTGRMTKGRAAGLGAMSGAWMGLFVGVLLLLFISGGWASILLTSMILGAVWGAVLGFLGHVATGGKRDFVSTGGFVAQRYDVLVDRDKARRAAEILTGREPVAPRPEEVGGSGIGADGGHAGDARDGATGSDAGGSTRV